MKNIIGPRLSGRVQLEAGHPLLADHFPGAPVAPGSLIVEFFAEQLRRQALQPARPMEILRVERFRFREFIRPGEYEYFIEYTEDLSEALCRIKDLSGRVFASGCFVLHIKRS